MFSPNKGMLYQWTEENLHLYKEGLLQATSINVDMNSQEFYSLTDRFHHRSQKSRPQKAFRSVENCLNLASTLNTSVAEQCNATMIKDTFVHEIIFPVI